MLTDASSFQDQLDCTVEGETLILDLPQERAGPVRILNAIILDGIEDARFGPSVGQCFMSSREE